MEHHLQKCLKNLKQQSFKDWRVIIVNDGSDNPALIQSIAKNTLKPDQYQIIHQENKGLSSARNTGIKASSTEFVMALDPDDFLHKDFLKEIIMQFNNKHTDIVYCWTQFQGESNFILDTKKISQLALLRKNLLISASPFRKSVWSSLGGFDESMKNGHEDWEFWIRACLHGFKFSGIKKVLFYYNVSNSGMNTEATIRRVDNIAYIRKKHSDSYPTSFFKTYKLYANEASFPVLLRFWLTNIFFICFPKPLRNGLFSVYRRFRS